MNLHSIKTDLTRAEKAVLALHMLNPGEYDCRIEHDVPYWIIAGTRWPVSQRDWNVLSIDYFAEEYTRLVRNANA